MNPDFKIIIKTVLTVHSMDDGVITGFIFDGRVFKEIYAENLLPKKKKVEDTAQVPQEEIVSIPDDKKTHKKTGRSKTIKGPVTERFCPKCDKTKQISEFNKNQGHCRSCQHDAYVLKKKDEESKEKEPADNHLSKKMMENSTGGDWDTAEIDILEANFFKLGGAELGALKIVEQNLLPGRTFQEINNMARYKGMMK